MEVKIKRRGRKVKGAMFGSMIEALGYFMFIALIATVGLLLSKSKCEQKYDAFDSRWGILSKCQIELDGEWIPADSYYFKEE